MLRITNLMLRWINSMWLSLKHQSLGIYLYLALTLRERIMDILSSVNKSRIVISIIRTRWVMYSKLMYSNYAMNFVLLLFNCQCCYYHSHNNQIWPEAAVQRCSMRKFSEISQTPQESTCAWASFLINLLPATLLKKRLWHRCFPVNFAKYSRTLFLQNNPGGCFCMAGKHRFTWFLLDLVKETPSDRFDNYIFYMCHGPVQ